MARVTRLELAASAVTGRRSNQLSYTRTLKVKIMYQLMMCTVNAVFTLKHAFWLGKFKIEAFRDFRVTNFTFTHVQTIEKIIIVR